MKTFDNVLGIIGNTPLVRINNITRQHGIKAQVYAKMESLNPGYSVKDRIGVSMIDDAEEKGILKKGGPHLKQPPGIQESEWLWSPLFAVINVSL